LVPSARPGAGAAVIMPAANAEAMSEHLKELSTQVTTSSIAVVLCDRAGWHQRGKELIVPDNIRLLSLPPYSPELNPMENVVKTNCVPRCGTPMTRSWKPAKTLGTVPRQL
jgi:hypothetical protein